MKYKLQIEGSHEVKNVISESEIQIGDTLYLNKRLWYVTKHSEPDMYQIVQQIGFTKEMIRCKEL